MELILSSNCESLVGSLNKHHGYFIQRRGKRFWGQRSRSTSIPPDGHWRFILACLRLTQSRLYVADIRIKSDELWDALYDAGHRLAADIVIKNEYTKPIYTAADVLNLKNTFGL